MGAYGSTRYEPCGYSRRLRTLSVSVTRVSSLGTAGGRERSVLGWLLAASIGGSLVSESAGDNNPLNPFATPLPFDSATRDPLTCSTAFDNPASVFAAASAKADEPLGRAGKPAELFAADAFASGSIVLTRIRPLELPVGLGGGPAIAQGMVLKIPPHRGPIPARGRLGCLTIVPTNGG